MRRRTFLGLFTGAIPSISRALGLKSWLLREHLLDAAPVNQQNTIDKSGIKIITFHRWSSHIPCCDTPVEDDVRQSFYLQGEWRRLEAPRRTLDPLRRFGGPLIATIVRPDLGQIFELNLDAREYFSWPWPPDLTDEAFKALVLKMTARLGKVPTDPTFRTETTDTGERKEMFGYLAKHLITTTKLWIAHEEVRDGWYIDLEPQFYPILYQPQWIAGELRYSGTGFPVQEVRTSKKQEVPTSRNPNLVRAGSREKVENRSEIEVTIEKGTYDQALFEVPPGFKLLDYNPVKLGMGKRHHLLRQSSTSNPHKSRPFDAT